MKKGKVRSALIALAVLLAGCSSNAQYNSSASGNVGTAWGGDVHSSVQGVSAERAWRDPAEMIVISYSTNVPSGYDRVYSIRINELESAIRDGNFNSLPITRVYDSSNNEPRYIVHARVGMNYQLYVRNYSRNTNYEIVATVDGLDVLNGKQGSLNNNGYIVNAGDSLSIKGFRKDKHTEAAFQFANVADSYAANSAQGDVRNTGVIGFAAFELQGPAQNAMPPCSGQAFPADNNGYAPPPCRK